MTLPAEISFAAIDSAAPAEASGRLAVLVPQDGGLPVALRRIDRLTRGALSRLREDSRWESLAAGEGVEIPAPAGLAASVLHVVKVPRRLDAAVARKAGGSIGKGWARDALTVVAPGRLPAEELALGILLGAWRFDRYRTEENPARGGVTIMLARPEEAEAAFAPRRAVAEGVIFARDLVSEPANVLTTEEFARRLLELSRIGLEVEVLEEEELARLGMRALLAVGQGSHSPSKVVVMRWQGLDAEAAPLALVGKGVVFDTGGISLKPAQGMEEMTMDMGGAAVVAGTMKALALRRAQVNAVGVVGLVENMPSGHAQRPGDIVRTMKGDTVEVINTDAEGRLVLADILWYAQERFAPRVVVDLATLTGAIIIALGHHNAGVFSPEDAFARAILRAAETEGEGAWRMPLGAAYARQLRSNLADVKNVGGRPAGAVTAAEFLRRFVREGTPWAHIDIAGVALLKEAHELGPKGATGWGVRTLDRLADALFAEG